MRGLIFLGVAVVALTACSPAHNPYMGLGKEISSADTPTQEHEVYFKEPVSTVYDAIIIAGNRNDLRVVQANAARNAIVVEYPFSLLKNIWGGRLNVNLADVGGSTRLIAQFYEKDKRYTVGSILNPFIEDVKTLLAASDRPS